MYSNLYESENSCTGAYRFGFNTQEKTDEIAGTGNHTTAEYWEYDPRTGKRWNRDPKPLVDESPYATNRNNPERYNDPEGDCPPGSPCATARVGVSFSIGSKINRVGLNISGTAGFGASEVGASLTLFKYKSFYGQSKGGNENQLSLSFTQGFGKSTSGSTSSKTMDMSLAANNSGRANSATLYTTIYREANTSQRVAGIGLNAGNLKIRFEDDYLPLLASNSGLKVLGDAGDKFRTAALQVQYKLNNDISLVGGFTIFTGDPRGGGQNTGDGPGVNYTNRKRGDYNYAGTVANGILYGGVRFGNYTVLGGRDSEAVRESIVNKVVHPLIGSPNLPVLPIIPTDVFQIQTNTGTSLY